MNNIILFNPSASENGSSAPSNPTADPSPHITTARDFIRRANAAFHEGNLPAARASLRSALAFHADDSELILALGHVEFGLGHHELALQRYSLVVEMNPIRAEAHSSRALSLKLLGRHREAAVAARRALSRDPSDLVALKVLTRIHLDEGRHDRARQLCRQILNVNPSDTEGLRFLDQCQFDMAELAMDAPTANIPKSSMPAGTPPVSHLTPKSSEPRLASHCPMPGAQP